MSIFHSMNTTASALTAGRMRMDVISSNMANADTTRANYVNGKE
jgi:flagellar basal-body rod protein FlgC